mmetsp:Transcript_4997/g.9216  ORF Transcript_4997/g.9216 Transcript_4997/m.9216 type:complete len:231 (-) Transcript_4997:1242-1934(-)
MLRVRLQSEVQSNSRILEKICPMSGYAYPSFRFEAINSRQQLVVVQQRTFLPSTRVGFGVVVFRASFGFEAPSPDYLVKFVLIVADGDRVVHVVSNGMQQGVPLGSRFRRDALLLLDLLINLRVGLLHVFASLGCFILLACLDQVSDLVAEGSFLFSEVVVVSPELPPRLVSFDDGVHHLNWVEPTPLGLTDLFRVSSFELAEIVDVDRHGWVLWYVALYCLRCAGRISL